jgi:hypothetical protein
MRADVARMMNNRPDRKWAAVVHPRASNPSKIWDRRVSGILAPPH